MSKAQDQEAYREEFSNRVCEAVYETFSKLPKKGKPQPNKEWTLIAAILSCKKLSETKGEMLKVLSLGTGSKCIGKSKLSTKGDILNDSHAEVLARRAFLLFLYNELIKTYSGVKSEYFQSPCPDKDNRCSLKDGISFHLFTSQTPCGDASIFPKTKTNFLNEEENREKNSVAFFPPTLKKEEEKQTNVIISESTSEVLIRSPSSSFNSGQENHQSSQTEARETMSDMDNNSTCHRRRLKRKIGLDNHEDIDQIGMICVKHSKKDVKDKDKEHPSELGDTDGDIFRTGAKCVPGGAQDPLAEATAYHTTGALRTKPGRGERTESMSCSDKMARWNGVGCQGALLSLFLWQPIYLSSVIIGKCPYSQPALQRAIINRVMPASSFLEPPYKVNQPNLCQSVEQEFEFSRSKKEKEQGQSHGRLVPCSSAIAWNAFHEPGCNSHDVTVNGKCQGVTKADLNSSKARSQVCSLALFHQFHRLVSLIEKSFLPSALQLVDLKSFTYGQTKNLARDYQTNWNSLLQHAFPTWITKSRQLLDFKVDVE